MSWRLISLGELVTSHWSGYSFRSQDYTDAGVAVLTKGDVKQRGVVEHGTRFVDPELVKTKSIKLTTRHDLLVTTRDLTTAANFLGLVAKAPDSEAYAVNQGVTVFRVDESKVNRDFLAYWCEGEEYRGHVKGHYAGATQIHIRHGDLMAAPVRLPHLRDQRRIASILSAYDDLIENNTRRIAILELMAGRIYEEWFVRFRFPGHDSARLVESELGLVPEGWQCSAFTDLADVLSGGTPKKSEPEFWNGAIPFFTPTDVPKSAYTLDTEAHITEAGLARCASRLYPQDTLFITARGTVGKLALASRGMAMNQSCYALRARAGYGQLFLYFATLSVVGELKAKSHGAVFDTIIMDTFRLMRIVQPPVGLAARFEEIVRPMLALSLTLSRKNANLRATRDLLLPKLISGELDVTAMPELEGIAA